MASRSTRVDIELRSDLFQVIFEALFWLSGLRRDLTRPSFTT